MDVEGEDDDVPSPRTLRAAVERLAQFTSEQQDAALPLHGQGFADLYSEVGSPRPVRLNTRVSYLCQRQRARGSVPGFALSNSRIPHHIPPDAARRVWSYKGCLHL